MTFIFLSYRHSDSPDAVDRIYDGLAKRFGSNRVFRDVNSISPGEQIHAVIDETIARGDVLLAIIGPGWLAKSGKGESRISEEGDFVRREIEAAIAQNILVVPVLLGDVAIPQLSELPDSLAKLPTLQAIRIRKDPDFHRDLNRLIVFLGTRNQAWKRWAIRLAIGVGVMSVIVGLQFAQRYSTEKDDGVPPYSSASQGIEPVDPGDSVTSTLVRRSTQAVAGDIVTDAQYRDYLRRLDLRPPPNLRDDEGVDGATIVGTTWIEARQFCESAGLRLPGENEWLSGVKEVAVGPGGRRLYEWTSTTLKNDQARVCHEDDIGGETCSSLRSKSQRPGDVTFRCIAE